MNRILIVDDDTAMQLLYRDELTEEGYDVITTGDTSGLLELIGKKRPDLIVLAMQLCKHSGMDHLEHVRRVYNGLPVVIAMADAKVHPDTASIAADDTVEKISNLKELKRKIRTDFAWGADSPVGTLFGELKQEVTPAQNTMPEPWQ